MGCEEIRHRLADDLRNELPEADRAELHAHLASCEGCRQECESLEQIWSGLGDIAGERPDTGTMRARFDQMLHAQAQAGSAAGSPGGWHGINARLARWWPGWAGQPLVQAGFAAGMLIVGVCAGSIGRAPVAAPPQPAADLGELRRDLHDMRAMLTLSLMHHQSAGEPLPGVSCSRQIERPGTDVPRALLGTLI